MSYLSVVPKRTELTGVAPRRLLYSVREVASLLACGRTKAYELVSSGQLPVVRIGRSVRVPASALREWIKHQTTDAK